MLQKLFSQPLVPGTAVCASACSQLLVTQLHAADTLHFRLFARLDLTDRLPGQADALHLVSWLQILQLAAAHDLLCAVTVCHGSTGKLYDTCLSNDATQLDVCSGKLGILTAYQLLDVWSAAALAALHAHSVTKHSSYSLVNRALQLVSEWFLP
jgi:hypothetical protein